MYGDKTMIIPNNHILVTAIKNLNPNAKFSLTSIDDIRWAEGTDPISKELIQAEIDNITPPLNAIENRKKQYPSIQDVVVALAEKEEGNDAMWQEITAQRAKVKSDNPKPE